MSAIEQMIEGDLFYKDHGYPLGSKSIYAIWIELDWHGLLANYGLDSKDALTAIKEHLVHHGFAGNNGSNFFFGGPNVSPVQCVLAVQSMCASLAWFKNSAFGIKMLRIEETNDLRPAMFEGLRETRN